MMDYATFDRATDFLVGAIYETDEQVVAEAMDSMRRALEGQTHTVILGAIGALLASLAITRQEGQPHVPPMAVLCAAISQIAQDLIDQHLAAIERPDATH